MHKGYTLIEVLVVIVIIGLIASIVYPAVGTILANSRKTAREAQIDTIIKGAKEWGYKNSSSLPGCVSVQALVDGGFISGTGDSEVIVDPTDRSHNLSDGCVYITVTEENNQFVYSFSTSCSECSN